MMRQLILPNTMFTVLGLIILSSCSIQPRKHMPGYHVSWKKGVAAPATNDKELHDISSDTRYTRSISIENVLEEKFADNELTNERRTHLDKSVDNDLVIGQQPIADLDVYDDAVYLAEVNDQRTEHLFLLAAAKEGRSKNRSPALGLILFLIYLLLAFLIYLGSAALIAKGGFGLILLGVFGYIIAAAMAIMGLIILIIALTN